MATLRVLIIEDSPTQAQQIASNLIAYGADTTIAGDGPDGLRAVDEYQPDLIILDINLPTMDGYQVCRRLKRDQHTAHIPVIMLTSNQDFNAMAQGLETGADDYIPKDMFAGRNLLATLRGLGLLTNS